MNDDPGMPDGMRDRSIIGSDEPASGVAPDDPAANGSAATSSASNGPAASISVSTGPASHGPASHGSATDSPAASTSAANGSGPASSEPGGATAERPAASAPAGEDSAADDPVADDPVAEDPVAEPAEQAAAAGKAKPADAAPAGRRRRPRSFWHELPVLIVIALAIALLIKTFVVQAFYIPSSSMEDTLLIGDKVLVNKVVYHMRSPQPGDIIVFDGAGSWDPVPPAQPASSDPVVRLYQDTLVPLFHSISGLFGTVPGQTDYIKRVIGAPGDIVACCNAQGLVTVNGVPLHEKSYLFPGAVPSQIHFQIKVPPGRLWVMGDNRLVSDDSRLHRNDPGSGTIPEDKVIGRAFMIVWPPSRWGVLGIPSTFSQPGIAAAAAGLAGVVTTAGAAPYLPLAGGVVLAVPLTWLQRRARLRLRHRLRRRR
jgi:signal peptidase I